MRGAAGLVRVSDWAHLHNELELVCLCGRVSSSKIGAAGLVRVSDWAHLHNELELVCLC